MNINVENRVSWLDAVIDVIDEQPSAGLEQLWIPCIERLPEDGVEVFVYLFDSPYIAWVDNGCWYTEDFEVDKEEGPIALDAASGTL